MPAAGPVAGQVSALLEQVPRPREGCCRFLVTAGPTCEDLDAVRFLSNRSTGKMGFAIAVAARDAGHQAVLIAGPTPTAPPAGISAVNVRSAQEMHEAVLAAFDWCDALVMAAAVADYRPADYVDGKISKDDDDLVLRLVRTPDILVSAAQQRGDQVLVGFSLQKDLEVDAAVRKREAKKLDIIVANSEHAFGGAGTDAVVLERGQEPYGDCATKRELAEYLVRRIVEIIQRKE